MRIHAYLFMYDRHDSLTIRFLIDNVSIFLSKQTWFFDIARKTSSKHSFISTIVSRHDTRWIQFFVCSSRYSSSIFCVIDSRLITSEYIHSLLFRSAHMLHSSLETLQAIDFWKRWFSTSYMFRKFFFSQCLTCWGQLHDVIKKWFIECARRSSYIS